MCPTIECMLAVSLPNSKGHLINYILVSDNNRRLYTLQDGVCVRELQVPANVSAVSP